MLHFSLFFCIFAVTNNLYEENCTASITTATIIR